MKLDIKNGEIKRLIVGNVMFHLKKNVGLGEVDKLEKLATLMERYIDLSRIATESLDEEDERSVWGKEELEDFLDDTDSDKQIIFLKSLAKTPERLSWNQLKEIMERADEELKPFTMAGVLSCFARRAKKHYENKEDFWESIWDEKADERIYRLKEPYRKIFAEYFEVKRWK